MKETKFEKKVIEINGTEVTVNSNGFVTDKNGYAYSLDKQNVVINGKSYNIKCIIVKAFFGINIDNPNKIRIINPKYRPLFSPSNLKIIDADVPVPTVDVYKTTEYCEIYDISDGNFKKLLEEIGLTMSVNQAAQYIKDVDNLTSPDENIIANIRNNMRGDCDIIYDKYVCFNVPDNEMSDEEKFNINKASFTRKLVYNNKIFKNKDKFSFKGSDIRKVCKRVLSSYDVDSAYYKFSNYIMENYIDTLNEDTMYRIHTWVSKEKDTVDVKIFFDSYRNRQMNKRKQREDCNSKRISKKGEAIKEDIQEIKEEDKIIEAEEFYLKCGNAYIKLVPIFVDSKEEASILNEDSLNKFCGNIPVELLKESI